LRVLVIGGGGREHALVDAIARHDGTQIYCAPGNAGISSLAEIVRVKADDVPSLLKFADETNIDFIVVGPEQPLSVGIVDAFTAKGIRVFGPTKLAARLESSKVFAKEFMKRWKIPTSGFATFSANEQAELVKYLKDAKYPVVLKADGLAAGKGVSIINSFREAEVELDKYFVKKIFGSSADRVVVEEFMKGIEASVFAITDGQDYVILPPAQDHKRVGDNDTGKNTGGMGAFAPTPFITDMDMVRVKSEVIEKVLEGTRAEGFPYSGCLYCGLMLTQDGPKVVEFNVRFGDPETQAVLPLVKSSMLDLLCGVASNEVKSYKLELNDSSAVCVIAASKGYPDEYEKGKVIEGLGIQNENLRIYHSGSKRVDGKVVTAGGRVLGVTGIQRGGTIRDAAKLAYDGLSKIQFDGMFFRHDIARTAIEYESSKGSNR